jgi:hypothetical protein
MNDALMRLMKEKALAALEWRRANPRPQIQNDQLHAGEPIYFYCISCGWLSDVKPEDYLFGARRMCSECDGLKEKGWLA